MRLLASSLLLALAAFVAAQPPPGQRGPPPGRGGPLPGGGRPAPANEDREKLPDRKTYKTFFEALVEPVAPEPVVIPLEDEVEMQFIAATSGIQKWVQDKISLEGLNMKTDEQKQKWEAKAAENKAKAVELHVEAVKNGATFQEAHIGMALAQFKLLPEGAQEEALEKAREKFKGRPEGRRERTREHASEANHMEKVQIEQLTTDEERKAWVEEIMQNGPPHAKKMREERKKEAKAKGGTQYQQVNTGAAPPPPPQ
eukprot:CAMPEP_0196724088 /NCGR_PEP_ID=MMETSP1091-20130531/6099_1 /TAXON_ID=302021 /ORGANISM="Rhodomonas sp., Strain CCMP768" /LENGTH=255 /DNA_ID=CAMNT_0042066183 /DNA_START=6 /DNA_END=773 /DNA_ORIENTATION=+